jgi:hypothetical protein
MEHNLRGTIAGRLPLEIILGITLAAAGWPYPLFRFSWKWRKSGIRRRHLLEQVPISELCDKHGLQPTGLLPLAEGVLRERGGRVSAQGAA